MAGLRTVSADERFGFRVQGCFRCTRRHEKPMVIVLVAMLVAAPPMMLIDTSQIPMGGFIFIALILIWVLIFSTLINFIISGERFRFDADENEMRIYKYAKNGAELLDYTFRYKDVTAVTYKPMKSIWRNRGYIVTVSYKGRDVRFNYMHPKRGSKAFADTPFCILLDKIDSDKNTVDKA